MSTAKKIGAFGAVLLLVVGVAAGALAYSYLKPTEAASEPIQALPIVAASAIPTSVGTATAAAAVAPATIAATTSSGSTASTTTTATPATSGTASGGTTGATLPTSGASTTTAATGATSTASTATYTIVQSSSQARFVIDEVLNGAAKTVIGSTDQVAGQIAVNPTAPTGAQVGTIRINARTLSTDSEQRNNAIKNRILLTNQYEYITFVPTGVTGLPATATVGQTYTLRVVGQLTVAAQTHEAAFDVTVTPNADGTLTGSAKTTIKYADWGLTIPSVPSVTGVSDTLALELDFVAKAN